MERVGFNRASLRHSCNWTGWFSLAGLGLDFSYVGDTSETRQDCFVRLVCLGLFRLLWDTHGTKLVLFVRLVQGRAYSGWLGVRLERNSFMFRQDQFGVRL